MTEHYADAVLQQHDRDAMIAGCPALAVMLFQTCFAHGHVSRSWLQSSCTGEMAARTDALHDSFLGVFLSDAETAWRTLMDRVNTRVSSEPLELRRTPLDSIADAAAYALEHPRSEWRKNPSQLLMADASISLAATFGASSGRLPLDDKWAELAIDQSRLLLEQLSCVILEGGSAKSLAAFPEAKRATVVRLLQHVSLVDKRDSELTGGGLTFCLSDIAQQWSALIQCAIRDVLATTPAASLSLVLRHLAVMWVSETSLFAFPFPSKESSPVLFVLLARLSDVGLVLPLQADGKRLFVVAPGFRIGLVGRVPCPATRALMARRAGLRAARQTAEEEDTIITETNFRLYAYTQNRTLLSVLDQFAVRDTVVSGWLVCYKITRDAFTGAVRRGITTSQVLQFLELKAHPAMRARASRLKTELIPNSIGDQLRMWESDCRRVEIKPDVYLMSNLREDQIRDILSSMDAKGFGREQMFYHGSDGTLVVSSCVYKDVVLTLMQQDGD